MIHLNSVPDEILVHVFHLVADAQSRSFKKLVDEDVLPVNILATSQVCRRWRDAALDCQNLWTHIDISFRNETVSLATVFASRSGNLPLSLHIVGPVGSWAQIDMGAYVKVLSFITEVGSLAYSIEISSLDLVAQVWLMNEVIFQRASPQLTRLILSNYDRNRSKYGFLIPSNPTLLLASITRGGTGPALTISQERFEDAVSNVRILKLNILYPYWESKAYHDLTELRLTGSCETPAILSTDELAGILAASPGLRILHFGLEVNSTGSEPTPINLGDLEIFILDSPKRSTQEYVLSLVSPGTKLLRMSTMYDNCAARELQVSPTKSWGGLGTFFRRSSIVHLQLCRVVPAQVQFLLPLLPNLQTLIFRESRIQSETKSSSSVNGDCPEFNALHFISCAIALDDFLWLVSGRKMKEVTIWDSQIINETDSQSAEDFREVLTGACPIMRFLGPQDYWLTPKLEGWDEDT